MWSDPAVESESARADYYQNLSNLQQEMIRAYRDYLFQSNPGRLKNTTPREWDLGSMCYYLQRDNEALRELNGKYRKILKEYGAQINRA